MLCFFFNWTILRNKSISLIFCFDLRECLRVHEGWDGGSDSKESACIQETRVKPPGWEDSVEEEMAAHSSILAWRIPWTEEPGYSLSGRKEADVTEQPTH